METNSQPLWNNMVQFAFIAANVVSDDVSTVTAGLFPEGDRVTREEDLSRKEASFGVDREAARASAASATVPFLLCSSPAEHGSVALSARVLGMFEVLSGGPPSDLLELCAARSMVSGQGPLLFALLRISLFLLVRLDPFSKPALENVPRLALLVQCLLSDDWQSIASSHSAESEDMCIVILVHIHAALRRLKSRATIVGGTPYRLISEARAAIAGEAVTDPSVLPPAMGTSDAYEMGRTLLSLLRYLTRRRQTALTGKLGEPLTSALQQAITFEPKNEVTRNDNTWSASPSAEREYVEARRCWDRLLQSLEWMEESSLFVSARDDTAGVSDGPPALLEACMPSLKVGDTRLARST